MTWTKITLVASLIIIVCVLYAGCLAKFPYMSKTTTDEQNESEQDEAGPASSQQGDKKPPDQPKREDRKIHEDKKQDRMKQAQPEPKFGERTEKKKPEDMASQVKAAALDLSKSLGNIKKAKVCYATKDKEWWAVFYQDIESAIDVRQFFWNPDTEKLEPFLVLKRIPRDKLDPELKKDEPGKSCTVLTLPTVNQGSRNKSEIGSILIAEEDLDNAFRGFAGFQFRPAERGSRRKGFGARGVGHRAFSAALTASRSWDASRNSLLSAGVNSDNRLFSRRLRL